jgi:organic radical activating enzyme
MTSNYLKLEHGNKIYEDYFVVNWCFFSICNFSCSYCPTTLHDGKIRGLDIEIVKSFCQKIIQAQKGKKVFFEFTGGEMTYYKSFIPLFEFLKGEGAETGLISNGSRDLDFWQKHQHLIDHICLSFHPEQGDADHFYEVVKLLNHEKTVHVNIMMLPSQFEKLHDLSKRISSEIEGISVSMQALFEEMSGGIFSYPPEQKKILDEQTLPWGQNLKHFQNPQKVRKVYRGEMKKIYQDGATQVVVAPELIAKAENNWNGWKCYAGLENIVIDFHGNVKRGWCGVGGNIGNVSSPDFELPKRPILCNSNSCHCGLDIMATKEFII